MGEAKTLTLEGKRNLAVYRARLSPRAKKPSPGQRFFCKRCGSALWVFDRRWKDWIYPFASAIDSPLPTPRERQHVFLDAKASWVEVPKGKGHKRFEHYPREAIVDWHRKRNLLG